MDNKENLKKFHNREGGSNVAVNAADPDQITKAEPCRGYYTSLIEEDLKEFAVLFPVARAERRSRAGKAYYGRSVK